MEKVIQNWAPLSNRLALTMNVCPFKNAFGNFHFNCALIVVLILKQTIHAAIPLKKLY